MYHKDINTITLYITIYICINYNKHIVVKITQHDNQF